MSRYYIGMAASYHDPALAVVDSNGQVVFAEATERYLQYKRAMSCPPDNRPTVMKIVKEFCEPDAEFVLARSWSSNIHKKLGRMHLLGLFNQEKLPKRSSSMTKYLVRMYEVFSGASVMYSQLNLTGTNFVQVMRADYDNNQVYFKNFSHHRTHAATACYTSSYPEAACMVVDGLGEEGSISYFAYKNGRLEELKDLRGPESLGILYSTVTTYCGFDPIKGEEWKVMGLAPYGKLIQPVYDVFMDLLQVNGMKLKYVSKKHIDKMLRVLEEYRRPDDVAPREAADLAYTIQAVYEEVMTRLLTNFHAMGVSDNLCLGGGCGLNSAYNGKIITDTPFKNAHIPMAPADDGNALGAALLAYYEDHPERTHEPRLMSPYLGSEISRTTLRYFNKFSRVEKVRHLPGTVHLEAAKILAQGKLIGWVQGRAEFGPRALGNRSMLADPRPADMKDKINALVKFREEFRPFAPSILNEYGPDYFEDYQETPYMERTLIFKEGKREEVPAVVHANTTGRLQSVTRELNPRYYDLIKAFYDLTGVPIVLNTSFNIMGKPIMHSVEDALGIFYCTGLDALVIDDYLIEK